MDIKHDIRFNIYMIEGYLTTKLASGRCGLSQDHVRRLLECGTTDGVKLGHDWLVLVCALDHYMANRPKPGPKPRRGRRVRQNRN